MHFEHVWRIWSCGSNGSCVCQSNIFISQLLWFVSFQISAEKLLTLFFSADPCENTGGCDPLTECIEALQDTRELARLVVQVYIALFSLIYSFITNTISYVWWWCFGWKDCEYPFRSACCNNSTCKFETKGKVCKPSNGPCDLDDVCNGESAICRVSLLFFF